jgi:phosphinothricin acetyltransferase
MKIREAQPEDFEAMRRIYNASIPSRMATADTEPIPARRFRSAMERRDRTRRPVLVSEIEGEVAGFVSLSDFYGRAAYHATAEIGVYVHPEHQRRGVGRALVIEAIERAPRLGLRKLVGFVFAHNDPSVRLLEALGFEQWGRLPGVAELDGRWCDVLILGRDVRTE